MAAAMSMAAVRWPAADDGWDTARACDSLAWEICHFELTADFDADDRKLDELLAQLDTLMEEYGEPKTEEWNAGFQSYFKGKRRP